MRAHTRTRIHTRTHTDMDKSASSACFFVLCCLVVAVFSPCSTSTLMCFLCHPHLEGRLRSFVFSCSTVLLPSPARPPLPTRHHSPSFFVCRSTHQHRSLSLHHPRAVQCLRCRTQGKKQTHPRHKRGTREGRGGEEGAREGEREIDKACSKSEQGRPLSEGGRRKRRKKGASSIDHLLNLPHDLADQRRLYRNNFHFKPRAYRAMI